MPDTIIKTFLLSLEVMENEIDEDVRTVAEGCQKGLLIQILDEATSNSN